MVVDDTVVLGSVLVVRVSVLVVDDTVVFVLEIVVKQRAVLVSVPVVLVMLDVVEVSLWWCWSNGLSLMILLLSSMTAWWSY